MENKNVGLKVRRGGGGGGGHKHMIAPASYASAKAYITRTVSTVLPNYAVDVTFIWSY